MNLFLAQLDVFRRTASQMRSLNVLLSLQTPLNEISTFAINIMTDFISSVSYWLWLLPRCCYSYVHTDNYLCTYYVPSTVPNFTFILVTTLKGRILCHRFMDESESTEKLDNLHKATQ